MATPPQKLTITLATVEQLAQSVMPQAPTPTKIQSAFLCLAITDALGAPAEFFGRGNYPFLDTYKHNTTFDTPPGSFTDDTSMALCLAEATLEQRASVKSGTLRSRTPASDDPEDTEENLIFSHASARLFLAWYKKGHFSPTGHCFDIGNSTRQALGLWSRCNQPDPQDAARAAAKTVRQSAARLVFRGNGSLMRILPIPLAFWRDAAEAEMQAGFSSGVTHPDPMCRQACQAYTRLVCRILQEAEKNTGAGAQGGGSFTKLDLLKELNAFPFTFPEYVATLTNRGIEHPQGANDYATHPLLTTEFTDANVMSTGYVFHTFHAVLYVFFNTNSYIEGALTCVNLGHDTDTVGAIYGGLAGAWYGTESLWDGAKEKELKEGLLKREWVETFSSGLAEPDGWGWRGNPNSAQ